MVTHRGLYLAAGLFATGIFLATTFTSPPPIPPTPKTSDSAYSSSPTESPSSTITPKPEQNNAPTRSVTPDNEYSFLLSKAPSPSAIPSIESIPDSYVPISPFRPPSGKPKTILHFQYNAVIAKESEGLSNPHKRFGSQWFGVPLPPSEGQKFLDYCVGAESFLRESIPDSNVPSIDWVVIKDGDKFDSIPAVQNKGFLVDGYHMVNFVSLHTGPNAPVSRFVPLETSYSRAGMVSHAYPTIVLSAGSNALITPYSELVTFITNPHTKRQVPDKRLTHYWEETISEGIAFNVAIAFAKKNGLDDTISFIEGGIRNLPKRRPVYKSAFRSFELIRDLGPFPSNVQQAFDRWKTDAPGFMKEIEERK